MDGLSIDHPHASEVEISSQETGNRGNISMNPVDKKIVSCKDIRAEKDYLKSLKFQYLVGYLRFMKIAQILN